MTDLQEGGEFNVDAAAEPGIRQGRYEFVKNLQVHRD